MLSGAAIPSSPPTASRVAVVRKAPRRPHGDRRTRASMRSSSASRRSSPRWRLPCVGCLTYTIRGASTAPPKPPRRQRQYRQTTITTTQQQQRILMMGSSSSSRRMIQPLCPTPNMLPNNSKSLVVVAVVAVRYRRRCHNSNNLLVGRIPWCSSRWLAAVWWRSSSWHALPTWSCAVTTPPWR